ncbi:hypothetical protein PPERSA_08631 [Pseudocohnilembus persalinus]|uniref:Uncharacterized protein n=1 Tax=Pseudocohnilembus persalinus TaxID=266149 RepID=A0A0V0R541_PSEPJ|nr:hypothetical protein PPERSA_08631 [Pseudocohnilembus persalinus]|eukprot:KRX09599.1 hypothetical protein PPERSA_08631 [Pseudocohnilembus persalinus]
MDDDYVHKLHDHISLLSSEINSIKNKQNDFQSSMTQMMSKDKKDFIENPIDATEKFKIMKQKYSRVISELEAETVSLQAEIEALKSRKKYLETTNKLEGQDIIQKTLNLEKQLKEVQDRFESAKQRETIITDDVLKHQQNHSQVLDQFYKLLKKRTEKGFFDKKDEEDYQLNYEIEQNDYDEKVKVYEKLKDDIKKIDANQELDIRYHELKEKNQQLRIDLAALEKDRDILNYQIKELNLRVKLGDEEKEIEHAEMRRLKEELTKYQDILEDIKIRNIKRIEYKVQNSDSEVLRQQKNDYMKLERRAKELKDEYKNREKEFERQNVEKIQKELALQKLMFENQQAQQELERNFAKINQIKDDYDSRMTSNTEYEEQISRNEKEKQHYQIELRKLEEEHAYLKAKADFLQQNVNLEEELRKVKIDDLRNTIGNNLQFNESIAYLQNNWEEMRKFAKFR